MKKVLSAVLAAAVVYLAAPSAPVYAASLEQRLSEFVVQNPNFLQQVVEVKQDLDQGNKNAALNKVVAAVVANNNNNEIISLLSGGNVVETVGAQVRQGVESRVRQEVEARVGDKLLPYQSQISAVINLLNQQSAQAPSGVENSTTTGASGNY